MKMEELTDEVVLQQLRDSYKPLLTCYLFVFMATAISGAICAFMYGFLRISTISLFAIAFIFLILFAMQLYKFIFVEKSKVLEPFGNAIAMAGCIRAGGTFAIWQTPPARRHPLIITEEYIVSPERVQSYLPLSEIIGVRRCVLQGAGAIRCLFRARSISAANDAFAVNRRAREAQLPDTERYDMLILRDNKRHVHHYLVSIADFHDVLAFIREYQPEAVFKPDKRA